MKNIKIFPKDWLKLHPYQVTDPIDSYYTTIANRILEIIQKNNLASTFEKEDANIVALSLSAYFEDVISGLNIWRTFINEHKRLFDKYVPFYSTDDHYYDDEVNQEDVTFLIWHYVQQFRGAKMGSFISPDNEAINKCGKQIYQLFCDEWTTAPENERMQEIFSNDTRYDDESIQSVISWFYYQCYLFPKSREELSDMVKDYWKNEKENFSEDQIMDLYNIRSVIEPTPMLGYTATKWMSLIFPASHPDYHLLEEALGRIETTMNNQIHTTKEKIEKDYNKFQELAAGKTLLYFNSEKELKETLKDVFEADENIWEKKSFPQKTIMGATSIKGLEIIYDGIESIKDPENFSYNKETAVKDAISFYVVKHCSLDLMRQMENAKLLDDACAKSLVSDKRSHDILHDNWEFIYRYFVREI